MSGQIERTTGNGKKLALLLVLVGVLITTVAVQVSRYAGAASATSGPPPGVPSTPADPDSSDPAPGTPGNGAPTPGSGETADQAGTAPAGPTPPDASSSTARVGVPYSIHGTVESVLRPGRTAASIDVRFSNTNADVEGLGARGVRVSRLVVSVASVTGPNISDSRPCSAADFAVTQFDGVYPFYLPSGASSLSTLGFGSETWPTLRMKNTGSNQNGCKGATVVLAFEGES